MPRNVSPGLAFAIALLLAGAAAAQSPAAPFTSLDVIYRAPDGTRLAGTLAEPPRPRAAVVLLPGSGPTDRDASVGRHKPFRDVANFLAANGIAALRTDARGTGKSSGKYLDCSGDVLADDAIAGLRMLRTRPELRDVPVGFIGHSLGATVAAIAASRFDGVAFVVLLASPGRPDIENASARLSAQLKEEGKGQADIDAALVLLRKVTANPDAVDLRTDVEKLMRLIAGNLVPAGRMNAVVELQLATMRSPFGRYFTSRDPRAPIAETRCPVLAVTGSLDRVVAPGTNLPEIHRVLREAGNPDATVIEMHGLNHWLQTARTGMAAEIAEIDEAVSPRLLALVTGWVLTRGVR